MLWWKQSRVSTLSPSYTHQSQQYFTTGGINKNNISGPDKNDYRLMGEVTREKRFHNLHWHLFERAAPLVISGCLLSASGKPQAGRPAAHHFWWYFQVGVYNVCNVSIHTDVVCENLKHESRWFNRLGRSVSENGNYRVVVTACFTLFTILLWCHVCGGSCQELPGVSYFEFQFG